MRWGLLLLGAAMLGRPVKEWPATAQATGGWTDIATSQQRGERATGAGVGLAWQGATGRSLSVRVAAPRVAGRSVEAIAPLPGDNGPALRSALARLRAAGGGTLRMAPGTYLLAGGPPALRLDDLTDVLIEGAGAQLVFAHAGDGIRIGNSVRLGIRGLSLGYARPGVIAAVVRHGPGGTTLEVDPADRAAAAGATAYQVTAYDPVAGGVVPNGRRVLLGPAGVPLRAAADGRFALSVPGLEGFAHGAAVEIKLGYYDGAAIMIADPGDRPASHDLTFDGITIRNAPGSGVAVHLMGRGLALLGSRIGVRTTPERPSSIAYDAFHVTAMAGDILVRDNRFTASGDDAMNLASPVYDVAPGAGGMTATVTTKTPGLYPGATLALFDADLHWLGMTRVARRGTRDAKARMSVSFGTALPDRRVRYARNIDLLGANYAVVGNEVSRCQCHGLLAQGPNGLVRANRFTSLRANALRLSTSAWWHEGAGAHDVVVEDNEIRDTGDDGRRGIVWGAITVYGELGDGGGRNQPAVATAPLNGRLLIRNNVIDGVDQGCISIASSAQVRLAGNRCANVNRRLDRGQLMVELTDPAAGARRAAAKTGYLARGDGVWIDPLSTTGVTLVRGAY